jgi:hypothetical protein
MALAKRRILKLCLRVLRRDPAAGGSVQSGAARLPEAPENG